MSNKIIPFADLKARGVPFTRSYIHKLEQAGRFPHHVTVSEARVGWLEDEIDSWIDQLKEKRDAQLKSKAPTEAHARTEKARAARKGLPRIMPKRAGSA